MARGAGTLGYSNLVTAGFDHPGRREPSLRSQLLRTYPALWGRADRARLERPIDYSLSGLPFVVRLREAPSVLVCAGFSGDGVGPTRLIGEVIATMLTEGGDAGLPAALRTVPSRPLPPEPIRYLAGASCAPRSPARSTARISAIDRARSTASWRAWTPPVTRIRPTADPVAPSQRARPTLGEKPVPTAAFSPRVEFGQSVCWVVRRVSGRSAGTAARRNCTRANQSSPGNGADQRDPEVQAHPEDVDRVVDPQRLLEDAET